MNYYLKTHFIFHIRYYLLNFLFSTTSSPSYNPGWFTNPSFGQHTTALIPKRFFHPMVTFSMLLSLPRILRCRHMCQGFGNIISHFLSCPKYHIFLKVGEIALRLLMGAYCGVSCLTHVCNEPAFGLLAIKGT